MFKTTRKIAANTVVAELTHQVFIENTTPALTPPASELLEPVVNVSFDRVVPLRNKIIVQGTIFKNIIYKDTGNKIRHESETIPFSTDIEIPGFTPGTLVNGRRFPNGNDFKFFIETLFVDETLLNTNEVLQKIVIRFIVKVLRQDQIDVCIRGPKQVFKCTSEIVCN